jgi:hypothetical protein
MPLQVSTQYDTTHLWQWNNVQDRVAAERAFLSGSRADRRMAQALITANPLTPESQIREEMTVPGVPPRFGYPDEALTLGDVFGGGLPDPDLNARAPIDFSGGNGGYTGTDRNVSVF